jgi:hypothetical protein
MRSILTLSTASALLVLGCVQEERAPAHAARPTTSAVVVSSHGQQQALPPATVIDNTFQPAQQPQASANTPPPRMGVTEAQGPLSTGPDFGGRAASLTQEATVQIERLRQLSQTATEARKLELDTAVSDLENKRARVLQQMRTLDATPATELPRMRETMNRDMGELQGALRASYALIPALPPSDLR